MTKKTLKLEIVTRRWIRRCKMKDKFTKPYQPIKKKKLKKQLTWLQMIQKMQKDNKRLTRMKTGLENFDSKGGMEKGVLYMAAPFNPSKRGVTFA